MAAVPKDEIDMEAAVGRHLPLKEGALSVSMGLSTDSDLQGGTDCLLFRLLQFVSFVNDADRAQIKKWEFPEEKRDSCSARLVEINNEIDVLWSAKSISVGSRLFENLETEIMRKNVEGLTWKIDLLKGVVFQTISNIDYFRKLWLKRGEEIRDCKVVIEALKQDGENDKIEQRKLAEKSKALKAAETSLTSVLETLQEQKRKLKESYSEMALKLKEGAEMAQKVEEMGRKLREKDLLLETTRKKSEADKLQLEEKLSIEKSRAQQTKELNGKFSKKTIENLHSVLQNTKSNYRQLEKELSDTRRRSEGSQRKTKSGQNDGSDNLDIEVDHETGLQNGQDTIQSKTPSPEGGRRKRKVREN